MALFPGSTIVEFVIKMLMSILGVGETGFSLGVMYVMSDTAAPIPLSNIHWENGRDAQLVLIGRHYVT